MSLRYVLVDSQWQTVARILSVGNIDLTYKTGSLPFETFFVGFTTDMSEQPVIRNDNGTPIDLGSQDPSYNGDKTQPTEEILNALNALNPKAILEVTQNGHEPSLMQDESVQETAKEPPSEWHVLREKLRDHPQDPEGWNQLVDIAENNGDLEQIKQTYEALLETYPNTV